MTPRLPRAVSGHQLAKTLSRFGYEVTRQSGSHLRLTTNANGEHHVTVPAHNPLEIGTLSGTPGVVAEHLDMPKGRLVAELFGQPESCPWPIAKRKPALVVFNFESTSCEECNENGLFTIRG